MDHLFKVYESLDSTLSTQTCLLSLDNQEAVWAQEQGFLYQSSYHVLHSRLEQTITQFMLVTLLSCLGQSRRAFITYTTTWPGHKSNKLVLSDFEENVLLLTQWKDFSVTWLFTPVHLFQHNGHPKDKHPEWVWQRVPSRTERPKC